MTSVSNSAVSVRRSPDASRGEQQVDVVVRHGVVQAAEDERRHVHGQTAPSVAGFAEAEGTQVEASHVGEIAGMRWS